MTLRQRRPPFWFLRRTPRTVRAEIDEEIRVHLQMRADARRAEGLSSDQAHREARRRFGDIEGTRAYCRQQNEHKEAVVHRGLFVEEIVRDVRVAIRSLLQAPVLALTIVATVGLGIGATTVVVSAIDAAILRPLPYAEPARLMWIYLDAPPFMFRFSVADYLALETQQTHFDRVAGFTNRTMVHSTTSGADVLRGRQVSWTYFGVLGMAPVLGRDFNEDDARPGSPPAVIVSHGFWQQRLGGHADVIGQPVTLDGLDHTLAGVLPRALGPLEQGQDLFVVAQMREPPRRGPFPYWVVGRLRAGVDPAAAESELRAISRRIFPIWQSSYQDERATWSLMDLREHLVGDSRTPAGLALVAVVLVLLIACANASNLLVARVTSRRRELAVRAALGASRRRVAWHLLVESGLLALAATFVGALLAWAGVRLAASTAAAYLPRAQEITLDGPALWTLVLATVMGVLIFGLVPALHGSGGPVGEVLHATARSSTGSRRVRRLRNVLVGSQFAITTPLLVVAALLLVSLDALRHVDLGFDGRNMVTASIRLPAALYQEPGAVTSYWDALTRRLQGLPGVTGVALTDSRPPASASNINNFDLEDAPTLAGESQPATPWVAVTPDYFRVFGLAPIEGRLLDAGDAQREYLEAVVVDSAWAARFFPGTSAVGRRFREGGCTQCPWTTVVGVVGDVTFAGLDQPNQGTVYTPLVRSLSRFVVLRTDGDPMRALPAVRHAVRELDSSVAVTDAATIDDLVAQSLEQPRALSLLVGGLALAAVVLSVIGIYGVMAYYVQQRAKDIGIRLALGAASSTVLWSVVGRGMVVVAAGVIAGLAIAVASTPLVAGLLFRVGAGDVRTFAAVSALLLSVALAACLLPARRAVAVQPAAVLRNE